jgi:hypothetical protein
MLYASLLMVQLATTPAKISSDMIREFRRSGQSGGKFGGEEMAGQVVSDTAITR